MGFSVVVGGRHPWHCTMVKCFKLFEMSNWKKKILTQSVLLLPDWEPWIFQSTPSLTSLCAQCAGGGRVIGSISSNRVTQDSQTSCTSVSIAEIICLLSKNPITKIWHCLPPRYFMRFPEALLHIISAKSVAQALLQIVYWVSIPKEILTDHSTSFMSCTLKELYKLLGTESVQTIVYHPQTDGLVEQLNNFKVFKESWTLKTLKSMIHKLIHQDVAIGITG